MSVGELREILADPELREDVQLIDVREPWEAEEAAIPSFRLLPLSRWATGPAAGIQGWLLACSCCQDTEGAVILPQTACVGCLFTSRCGHGYSLFFRAT